MDAIKSFPRFSVFYLVIIILEILGITVMPSYHPVTKVMIMASLIGFYISASKRQNHIFLTGMIFALVGDVFLLFKNDDFFLIGLGCFLVMQICYFFTFKKKKRIPKPTDYFVPLVFVLTGMAVISYLWGSLGDIRWPVTVYAASIVLMAGYAYLRHPRLRGYHHVLTGVIFFIISDALLAVNKFGHQVPYGQLMVMATYMIAQYLIVTGEVLGDIKK